MAEIVIAIAAKVPEYLFSPIGRQFGYLFNYSSNVEHLKRRLHELQELKDRVDGSVNAATANGEVIYTDVLSWLTKVDVITKDAMEFLDNEDKAKKRCFSGSCPDLKLRYCLSKAAKRKTQQLVELRCGEFDSVSYPAPLREIEYTSIRGYEDFESRMSTLNGIMAALIDPKINIIGVYGMGGVGKTMLVKEVAERAKVENLFDEVIMVCISLTPDIRKIQEEIADRLGLRFDLESDFGRARRLYKRLVQVKSILLILDDVWAKLDLAAVGIPCGDDHLGCKIVLTSRNQYVLSEEMNTQKYFRIEVLTNEEAWNLFKKMVGDSVEAPELKPIAVEVSRGCGHLPITIATVASTLKNKGLHVWKDALRRLRSSAPANIQEREIFSSLWLSYDFLESVETKSLFLLGSLFPEHNNISIECLLKYGMGLGLFQGIDTLEEGRNRVYALVQILKASCLFQDSNITGFIRMHDVHDFGAWVASRDNHMLVVRNSVELEHDLTEQTLRICRAMSLPYSNIHELPTSLECPELELFMLLSNDRSLKIPDAFFERMKRLKVLNLTNMCFSTLPASLCLLTNLRTLFLDQCVLRDTSIIQVLKRLEILSFVNSDIEELPREIGQLTRLRLLDLKDCFRLKVIPSNAIASLSQLEELRMENCFVEWGVNRNASLAELNYLPRLTTLDIHIPDANFLPNDLRFEMLMRYRIFIGDVWSWSGDYETSKVLKLKLNTSIRKGVGINMLMKRTEVLYLDELNGIRSVLYDLDGEGFPLLKHLHVQSSYCIEYFLNTMEGVPNKAFPILESLFLFNLISLKEICHGQLPLESFCNLRKVKVEHCDRLKNLFSLSMARSLLQLQEIEITGCKIMDEIVVEGREEVEGNNEAMDKIVFPQLRYLNLRHLPGLISFCSNVKTMPSVNYAPTTDVVSEEIISECEHDIPIPLFNEKVAFFNLEKLVVEYISLKEIWNYQLPFGSFCKLKYLSLDCCDHLLIIVPSNMLMRLQNMVKLRVSNSDGLEYIFDLGVQIDTKRHVVRATQLRDLHLYHLPSLKQIWKKDVEGIFPFQKLSSLVIFDCSSLINIFTTSIARSLVQLQELSITECDMVEEIVEEEGVEEAMDMIVFPQVTSLILFDLKQLKSFCQGIHISEWPSLKQLELSRCYTVEMFASELTSFEEMRGKGHLGIPIKQPLFLVDKVAFPNLEELRLSTLFSMKEIWQGQFHAKSFFKLRVLKVTECHEILKVFPNSLLQNLQNLEELEVDFCSSLEEIFEIGWVGEIGHAVTLPQLRKLRLTRLPNLTCFFAGSTTFSLPFLKEVLVEECPKLTTFSTGLLSTPGLEKVQVWEDKWLWKGNLNTTIQHLFMQKDVEDFKEDFKDSEEA